jgi:hypothetical protein
VAVDFRLPCDALSTVARAGLMWRRRRIDVRFKTRCSRYGLLCAARALASQPFAIGW